MIALRRIGGATGGMKPEVYFTLATLIGRHFHHRLFQSPANDRGSPAPKEWR